MPKIRNISPLGALDVPVLGRVVGAGEEVEVEAEVAALLTAQTETWEPVTASTPPRSRRTGGDQGAGADQGGEGS